MPEHEFDDVCEAVDCPTCAEFEERLARFRLEMEEMELAEFELGDREVHLGDREVGDREVYDARA